MNYYAARELKDENGVGRGLYHYTCMNDGRVWPVGNCNSWESCPACEYAGGGQFGFVRDADGALVKEADGSYKKCEQCKGKGLVKRDSPCPGHATPEEACEHYRQYLLSKLVIRGPKEQEWPKNKCAVEGCNGEAKYLADIPGQFNYHKEVCEAHANRESVEPLIPSVGEIWSS